MDTLHKGEDSEGEDSEGLKMIDKDILNYILERKPLKENSDKYIEIIPKIK